MKTEINSSIVKQYGTEAGANIVGIAASKDFVLAPDGFKPADVLPECLSVIVLGATFSPEALNDIDEYTVNRNAMLTTMTNMPEIAGLGIIGKNYLLTNQQYGNLLWLSAVLTDAELMPDEKVQSAMCSCCNKCVVACPAGALNDLASFGRKGCSKFFTIEDKKFKIKCFLCRTVCPYRFGKSAGD